MNYIIEGTVSELYADESDNFTFKVIGSEGFSLSQGECRFNVLCPDELEKVPKKQSENICFPCFIGRHFQYVLLIITLFFGVNRFFSHFTILLKIIITRF